MQKYAPFQRESAETLALQALTWLIGHSSLCDVFLGATGTSEQDLRERAGNPEFLSSVLDFLVMDDAWVIEFCDAHQLPYEAPLNARAALPGGEVHHWT